MKKSQQILSRETNVSTLKETEPTRLEKMEQSENKILEV